MNRVKYSRLTWKQVYNSLIVKFQKLKLKEINSINIDLKKGIRDVKKFKQ